MLLGCTAGLSMHVLQLGAELEGKKSDMIEKHEVELVS